MSTAKKKHGPRQGDYAVGFGKPPRSTRFKPGRSGNPRGRPPATRNFQTDVKALLDMVVRVSRDGKPRKISAQKAMLLRLFEKALGGDIRAIASVLMLAQTYNNEYGVVSTGLSSNDGALLNVFRARVLSGAAAVADTDALKEDLADGLSTESATSSKTRNMRPTKRAPLERIRSGKIRSTGDAS